MGFCLGKKRSTVISCGGAVLLALSALTLWGQTARGEEQDEPEHSAALDTAIIAAAKRHGVPEKLVRRVIMRESKYNARAHNRKFWGLMQISYPTAKSMGFKGTPQELLNPVVNLRYAVPYLANAFVIAGKREDAAVRLYAAGYYNTARERGLLAALRTANSIPLTGVVEEQPMLASNAVAQPPQSIGIFGALFGPGSQLQSQPQAQPTETVAAATPPTGAGTTQAAVAPPGTFDGPTSAMVASKDGGLAPPKKWTRDGGVTVMGRGEQGFDQIASREKGVEADGKSRRRARKLTAFAALDLPASSAQAYASAPAQDPRFAAAASQAAIAQATSSTTTPAVEPAADGSSQQSATRAVVAAADDEPDEKPVKRRRKAHKKKAKETKEAQTERSSAKSANAEPAVATTTQ